MMIPTTIRSGMIPSILLIEDAFATVDSTVLELMTGIAMTTVTTQRIKTRTKLFRLTTLNCDNDPDNCCHELFNRQTHISNPPSTYLLEFVNHLITPTITPTTVIVITAYRSVFHFCNAVVLRLVVIMSTEIGIRAVVRSATPTIAVMIAPITKSNLDSDSMIGITA